jgi:lipopolysaccharide heptosyltransferase II
VNKIIILKYLDKILGKPLIHLLPKIPSSHKNKAGLSRKILFVRPGGIGDAVLLLPAIKSLKSKFPGSDIDVLCEKRNAAIFHLSKDVDNIYLYDTGIGLLKCLTNNYDVVIDTEQWHRLSAVVTYLTSAPIRIGFETNERAKLFTHKIPYSHGDYEVNSFLHLIEPLIDYKIAFHVDESFLLPDNQLPARLSPASLRQEKNLVAIFPGASVSERRWGGEKFGKVADELNQKGFKIVILGSGADRHDAELIRKIVQDSIDLTGKTSLVEVASVLKKCRLLITADSGLMHIAYAVGTPTVSLFGPGIEKKWAPPGKSHKILNKRLSCSPCTKFGHTPRCKKKAACLSLIGIDEVFDTANQLLSQKT